MPDMLGIPTCSFCPEQLSDQAGAGWKWVGLVEAAAAATTHRLLEAPCQVHEVGGPPANSPLGQGWQAACAPKVTLPIGDNTGLKP